MNELDILRIVKSHRKPNMGGRADYTVQDLRHALEIEDSSQEYMSNSLISNLLRDKQVADENRFLRLISGSGERQTRARKQLEEILGLSGLFTCTTRSEVLELITRVDGMKPSAARLVLCDEPKEDDFGLTEAEKQTISYLATELQDNDQPVFHWAAPFNSGASAVVWNLWSELNKTGACSVVAILRPSDFSLPFEAELNALSGFLEARGHRVESPRLLVDAIISEKIMVVVLSPYALDATRENNTVRCLAKEFLSRRDSWTGPSQMLFAGESEWVAKLAVRDVELHSRKLKSRLRLSGGGRFSEFRVQWNRFSDLREQMLSEESGSRMRRAATYFRVQNTEDMWPISVKLRALFASNGRTAAYFDPTQGFKRLAGPRFEEFDDLKAYHDDVFDYVAYVRHLDQVANGARGKKKHYYLLQYISTAKHWLTEEALGVLIDKIQPDRPNPLKLATEKSRIARLRPIITEKTEVVSGVRKSNFFASIAVKAVVQDEWMASDPFARSLAHHRIANRLKDNENNKDLLDREFPYEPHWGRSRIFFLAETIRHLVRSCETYTGSSVRSEHDQRLAFPPPPERGDNGTDPSKVINYCYEVLYQNELNGNANGVNGRALAKRYGAYQLAVELLELMSQDFEVGLPHPTLRPEKRTEFMRECGFALLDIGELEKARACFDQACQELKEEDQQLGYLNALLDLILVESSLGRLVEAEDLLAKAKAGVETLHKDLLQKGVAYDEFRTVRKLYRRVLSRNAHLSFLKGNHEETLELIDQIENEERWKHAKERDGYSRNFLVPSFSKRLEPEQTHLLIAALHRRAAESAGIEAISGDFSVALDRCLKAMLFAQSEGHHHQAMGFRIALARCFRRMGRYSAAETILDAVHNDLLRYGCSERTFLTFLNEAGRVLAGCGDPIRAYATYLRPCMGRAKARGFRREAEQAAAQSIEALEAVRVLFLDCEAQLNKGGKTWIEHLAEAVSKHRKLISDAEDIFRGGPFEKDPLFAYAIADAEGVIETLRTSPEIDQHLKDVSKELSDLRQMPSGVLSF